MKRSGDWIDELVREHWVLVWRTAYGITADVQLAEDAAQETFIRAVRPSGGLDDRAPVAWLRRVAANCSVDQLRSRKDHHVAYRDPPPASNQPGLESTNPVVDAVVALPEDRRVVIVLYYCLSFSQTEIATLLDIPPGTVASGLSRAIAELRSALECCRMPDDPEQTLRRAWDDIPLPDPSMIDRVITNVAGESHESSASRRSQPRTGSMPLVAIVGLLALAGGVAIGTAFASTTKTSPTTAPTSAPPPGGPGFIPAKRWNTEQTGLTAPPQVPSALAANYPVSDTPGTYPPSATLSHIPPHGVVITVNLWPSTKHFNLKAHPIRTLPLRFSDVNARGRFEGRPPIANRYFIGAQINGQIVEVTIFLNHQTAPHILLPAIQAELNRIVIPPKPAH